MSLLGLLDDLERRRRREYRATRAWLIRVCDGQEGSISAVGDAVVNDGLMFPPLLLDYEDAGDLLGVSPATIKRLVSAGRLPAVKVANCRRVRRCDLEAYVANLGSHAPRPSAGAELPVERIGSRRTGTRG